MRRSGRCGRRRLGRYLSHRSYFSAFGLLQRFFRLRYLALRIFPLTAGTSVNKDFPVTESVRQLSIWVTLPRHHLVRLLSVLTVIRLRWRCARRVAFCLIVPELVLRRGIAYRVIEAVT